MSDSNWDDVRYLLMVARCGSFVKAGRRLGVQHTTVARRLQRLEEAANAKLVTRTREGVALTAAGAAVVERVARAEEAVDDALRIAGAFDEALEGLVRVATAEIFATGFLCGQLAGLYARHPQIELDLTTDVAPVDLSRREADLAVRLLPEGRRPQEPELLARHLGQLRFSLWGARAYLARRPLPAGPITSLAGHSLLHFGPDAPRSVGGAWLARRDRGAQYVLRANRVPVLLAAAATGLGLAVLPDFLAEATPGLVRISEAVAASDIWLLVHPDARRVRRVGTVHRWLAEVVASRFHAGA